MRLLRARHLLIAAGVATALGAGLVAKLELTGEEDAALSRECNLAVNHAERIVDATETIIVSPSSRFAASPEAFTEWVGNCREAGEISAACEEAFSTTERILTIAQGAAGDAARGAYSAGEYLALVEEPAAMFRAAAQNCRSG